jgi:hypothetical protein
VTRLDALKELAAKVKAGNACIHDFAAVEPVGCKRNDWLHAAFEGSLDAAKALHEAVLPGWWWVRPDGAEFGTIRVVGPDNGDCYPSAVGKDLDPARAWLLAILRALIAQEENT